LIIGSSNLAEKIGIKKEDLLNGSLGLFSGNTICDVDNKNSLKRVFQMFLCMPVKSRKLVKSLNLGIVLPKFN